MESLPLRASVYPDNLMILLALLVLGRVSVKSARRYEELVVWQLSARLRDAIFVLTKDGPASRDFTFRDQIRDSSSSAPSNISEGFAFYKPKLFARHLRIAIASLAETKNHLQDGAGEKRYFNQNEAARLIKLNERALKAAKRLLRYLDSCKGKPPTDWTDDEPPS
jgi:four helix bundle protein